MSYVQSVLLDFGEDVAVDCERGIDSKIDCDVHSLKKEKTQPWDTRPGVVINKELQALLLLLQQAP